MARKHASNPRATKKNNVIPFRLAGRQKKLSRKDLCWDPTSVLTDVMNTAEKLLVFHWSNYISFHIVDRNIWESLLWPYLPKQWCNLQPRPHENEIQQSRLSERMEMRVLIHKNENGEEAKKKLERLNILPLLSAPIVGGVVKIDRHARQVHDMTHRSRVSLQPIWVTEKYERIFISHVIVKTKHAFIFWFSI